LLPLLLPLLLALPLLLPLPLLPPLLLLALPLLPPLPPLLPLDVASPPASSPVAFPPLLLPHAAEMTIANTADPVRPTRRSMRVLLVEKPSTRSVRFS
jgi:hypothetical protein